MKPGMQPVFSNDLGSAFIGAVVESFRSHHSNHYLGRTALQKLVYFSKALGTPVPYSFSIYNYGPYSDQVTFAVDSMLADEVLVDQHGKPDYSDYKLGQNWKVLNAKFGEQLKPHLPKINSVVKALGKFRPHELELVSTLHFINWKLHPALGHAPPKERVMEEFFRIKGIKFEKSDVDSWYEALRKAKLI